MLAASSDASAPIVKLLLDKGANARAVDALKMTTTFAASFGNDTESLRLLIAAGGDVDAADDMLGYTPLMNAAQHGNVASVRLLLSKGARVNAVSGPPNQPVKNGIINLGHWTPLTVAAIGPAAVVKALVDAGANPKAVEARGMTPLMLAAASDHADAETVRFLIPLSDLSARDTNGETALDWALKSGATPIAGLLKAAKAPAGAAANRAAATPPTAAPVAHRAAIDRSVPLLERASGTFFVNGACGACHAQNATDLATLTARRRGIRISDEAAAQRENGASAAFAAIATRLLEREDGPAVDILLYTLAGFAAGNHPADRATDAMVFNVSAQQMQAGNWHIGGIPRPPIEDGDFSRTALGIRALTTYAPPGRGVEMRGRVARAVAWLAATKPLTTEDRSFRLLGLAWGGRIVRPCARRHPIY
jgi:ankyrin repeat protein